MSVNSIGSSSSQLSSQGIDPSQIRARLEESGFANIPSEKINDALSSAGLDEETISSLKTDIQAAIQEQFSSGSANPEKFQQAVKEAFEKNGVDFESTKARLKESFGDGFSGFGGGGFNIGQQFGVSGADAPLDLFTLLEKFSTNQDSTSSSGFGDPYADLTATFLDALFGVDEEA